MHSNHAIFPRLMNSVLPKKLIGLFNQYLSLIGIKDTYLNNPFKFPRNVFIVSIIYYILQLLERKPHFCTRFFHFLSDFFHSLLIFLQL